MIRPLTLVTMLAAMGAGLHVYQTKHEVALLDRDLRGIVRAIEEQNERSLALAAEWARLNEPERLRQTALRHLSLEPMAPAQFLRIADAERRLPQVAPFDGPPALFAAREDSMPSGAGGAASRLSLVLEPAQPEPAHRLVAAAARESPGVAAADAARAVIAPPDGTRSEPPREAAPPGTLSTLGAAAGLLVATTAVAAPIAQSLPAEPTRSTPPPASRPAMASASAPRPAPASRQAAEVTALPPIAGPIRAGLQGAEVPRPTASRIASSPSPGAARPSGTAPAETGSMLGAARSAALAAPVPFGSLPPPIPFGAAGPR
jgi:hypothetical protein